MPDQRTQSAAAIKDLADRVRENIGRVIVGRDDAVTLALVGLLADGHILIEDVPSIGKTTLAKGIARSVGCSFKRGSCLGGFNSALRAWTGREEVAFIQEAGPTEDAGRSE